MDNLTSLIDERDREVQNIVTSINELAQVGHGRRHSTSGLWVLRGATGAERHAASGAVLAANKQALSHTCAAPNPWCVTPCVSPPVCHPLCANPWCAADHEGPERAGH